MTRTHKKTDEELLATTEVLTDPDDVARWLKLTRPFVKYGKYNERTTIDHQNWGNNVTIDQDGTVSTKFTVNLTKRHTAKIGGQIRIPIQFKMVRGSVDSAGMGVTTFAGYPTYIGMHLEASNNPIKSLDHFPQTIMSYFDISNTQITSLKGIHHLKAGGTGSAWLGGRITSHLLGLMLVKKRLLDIHIDIREAAKIDNYKLITAYNIISDYFSGKKSFNVMACQEELIDADCDELAQI